MRKQKNGEKQQARTDKIVSAMLLEVSCWEEVFREFDLPDRDIQVLVRDIKERMGRIKG